MSHHYDHQERERYRDAHASPPSRVDVPQVGMIGLGSLSSITEAQAALIKVKADAAAREAELVEALRKARSAIDSRFLTSASIAHIDAILAKYSGGADHER